MNGSPELSPDLNKELNATLLNSDSFKTDHSLQVVFIDKRISQWRHILNGGSNKKERVANTIADLLGEFDENGKNALLLFLRVLQDQEDSRSAFHHTLKRIADKLEQELQKIFPEKQEEKIILEIDELLVTLKLSDGQQFRSPNRLNREQLKQKNRLTPLQYGQQLFQGVIHTQRYDPNVPSTYDGYLLARQKAQNKIGLQLHTSVRSAVYLDEWEYLADGDEPLALREFAPFYRLQKFELTSPLISSRPINFLFILSSPTDLPTLPTPLNRLTPLNLALERQIIQEAMVPLVRSSLATYQILDNPTLEMINSCLKPQANPANNVHILHLVAHGIKTQADFVVALTDQTGCYAPAVIDEFTHAVAIGSDLRLVTLATCLSGAANQDPDAMGVFQSLATKLVQPTKGVPAVIAMQRNLPIWAAQRFTQKFYADLARTGQVDKAMAATRHDLYTQEPDGWSWGIPMLILGQQAATLFHPSSF